MTNVHEIGSRVVSALTENGEAHAQLTHSSRCSQVACCLAWEQCLAFLCGCASARGTVGRCWAVPVAAGGSLLSTVGFTLQVGIVKEEQLKVHGF